jgi:serine-type D-Ala-D-Ala carboxypeptidase/endopeptidase (penicillin-binding protein 4)
MNCGCDVNRMVAAQGSAWKRRIVSSMRWQRRARMAVAAAAGCVLAVTTVAHAQTGERVLEPYALLTSLDSVESSPASADGVSLSIGDTLTGGALGRDVSALVVSGESGATLFDVAGDTPRIPASATKILTAVGVLTALGPDHRLHTRVVRDGKTLTLIGSGDPSLRDDLSQPTIGPTLQNLAQRTAAVLRSEGASGPFDLAADISAFSGPQLAQGWNRADVSACYVRPVVPLMASVPPAGACQPGVEPQIAALAAFGDYLEQAGVATTGDVDTRTAAPTAVEIAKVTSPPMSALVEAMMLDSDNTGAEMLSHLAGGVVSGQPSFAGGAAATLQALSNLGVDVATVRLDDASGMSDLNQVTMASVVGALQAAGSAEHAATLWPLLAGLPAAGFDGTLASRFDSAAASAGRGDVRAKTGTLTGTSALAGRVVTDSGELLTFAFVSNSTTNTSAARAQLDRAAAELAECGCQ